jgi:hypothetical protein
MSLRINNNILNQRGTPAFFSDVFANRPAAGFAGRVFISTDTGAIYEDTGSAWTLIADAGAGTTGTLQQVTTNGNTTTQGLVVTAGNVAIGTATAGAPLDIHCTGTAAQFNGTGTNNAYVFFQNAGANKWRLGNNYNAGANSLDIYNNTLGSVALSVNNPYNVLQLNANLAIKQSTGIFTIAGYNAIACDSGGFFFNCSTANSAYFNLINLTGSRSYTLPDTNGTLALTSNLSSYLPLTGGTLTGNLLISKATASASLQSTTTTNFAELQIENTTNYLQIGIEGATPSRIGGSIAYNGYLGTYNNYGMTFHTNNSRVIYITNGGQTLIGGQTSSLYANSKLSVKQTVSNRAAEIWTNYSGDLSNPALVLIKNDNNSSSSQVFQQFAIDNGNNANGQINGNGASQVAFGSWSDIRLKENIVNLPNQLQNILALRSVEFDYKDGSGHQIGFIAQEIKEVYPEAVSENDKGYLTVTGWNKTEAILVKAIQELHEKLVRNNIN